MLHLIKGNANLRLWQRVKEVLENLKKSVNCNSNHTDKQTALLSLETDQIQRNNYKSYLVTENLMQNNLLSFVKAGVIFYRAQNGTDE